MTLHRESQMHLIVSLRQGINHPPNWLYTRIWSSFLVGGATEMGLSMRTRQELTMATAREIDQTLRDQSTGNGVKVNERMTTS